MNSTTEVKMIPPGNTSLSHHRSGEEGQPKRVTTFHLLSVIVITALLAPPLVPGSSIRIDTILILICPFLVFIGYGRIRYDRRTRPVLLAFGFLTGGVGLALMLQVLLLGKPFYLEYLHNFQGYTRPLLFALLAAEAIRTRERAETMVKVLLAGIIAHGALAIIEFINLQPFTGILNLLYRGDFNDRLGVRALGAFKMVHDLAYFSLYGLLFSLAVLQHPERKPSLIRWARVATAFSLVALIIPFSRGAWIAGIAGGGFMLLQRGNLRFILSLILSLLGGFAIGMVLMPDLVNSVKNIFSSIIAGAQYLLGAREAVDEKAIGFITARLDWGWMHALQVWKENPLHGDLSYSTVQFIGDGGYTETLANHGLVGFFAFLAMFLALWKKTRLSTPARCQHDKWTLVSLRSFVVAFFFALFATGILKERSTEILPVMLISLIMLGKRP